MNYPIKISRITLHQAIELNGKYETSISTEKHEDGTPKVRKFKDVSMVYHNSVVYIRDEATKQLRLAFTTNVKMAQPEQFIEAIDTLGDLRKEAEEAKAKAEKAEKDALKLKSELAKQLKDGEKETA